MNFLKKKTEKQLFEGLLNKLSNYDINRRSIKNLASKEYKTAKNKELLNSIISNAKDLKINNFELSDFEVTQEMPLIKRAELIVFYDFKEKLDVGYKYIKNNNYTLKLRTFEGKIVLNFINELVLMAKKADKKQ